jgi:aspartate-semialdehyde dehydrogenase
MLLLFVAGFKKGKFEMHIAIVGATGLVGLETLKVLQELEFPVSSLKLLASEHSIGKSIRFKDSDLIVDELKENSFRHIDLAFFCAGNAVSRKFAPLAVESGAVVIDKSSAFRMDNHVPLIVPEVNPTEIFKHRGIIANPNCSTIQLVVALKPIYDLAGIKRLIVSTYQSVSGSGKDAISELKEQSRDFLNSRKPVRKVFPHQIAFNLLPHIDQFEDNGFTREEIKLMHEPQKIFADYEIKITATAVRVPVFFGHAESVYLETVKPLSVKELKRVYLETNSIKLVDDVDNTKYPLPIMSETYDQVMVGRIRRDIVAKNGINLWIVANNLRKGAALNAVQIAELLLK